jgi:hypothetical protein
MQNDVSRMNGCKKQRLHNNSRLPQFLCNATIPIILVDAYLHVSDNLLEEAPERRALLVQGREVHRGEEGDQVALNWSGCRSRTTSHRLELKKYLAA